MRDRLTILAIDQGTTNSKALLIAQDGTILANASQPLAVRYPQPAWVEQDPLELWASVRAVIDACLRRSAGHSPPCDRHCQSTGIRVALGTEDRRARRAVCRLAMPARRTLL